MSQSMREIKRIRVSWFDVELAVQQMATEVPEDCTGIYGVPRGGLVLATMLSYELGLPLLLAPIEGCVVVDDIADSGETLKHYTKYVIMTMYHKDRSIVTPNVFYDTAEENQWIVFPWEME